MFGGEQRMRGIESGLEARWYHSLFGSRRGRGRPPESDRLWMARKPAV